MFVQVASFAVLTTRLYEVLGQPSHGQIDRRITEAVEEPDQQPGLSLARLVLGLAAAAVVATSLGAWLLHSVRMEDNVLVIAHRGGAKVAPENTIAAFTRAIQDGADQVELDVQETADGEVVVIHDSDLMKIAGVDLRIWDATLEQIGEIDIGSHFSVEFRDQRIPRLADALQLCKGKVTVNIELKYYGHDKQLEQRVAEIVEAAGMESQIVAMSLEYEAVQKMKQLRPKWTVGLLTATAIGDVTKLDADFLAVSSSMASRQFIRRARGRRKPVYVWTVNDPIQLSRMISMGVDGVITDEPGLARSVLARRAQMSPVERLLINLAFWIGAVPNGAAAAPQ
jgi:glycerophosphoryl diester phosphodiesterase